MKFLSLLPSAALAFASTWLCAQGPLTPPPGVPAPTMKSLDQIEARTPIQSLPADSTNQYLISQSGSYYLTGNITGANGKNCIGIVNGTGNVTINLNGFTLSGLNGALTGINGPQASNLAVSNGTIFNFPGRGINAGVNGPTRLERLVVSHCAGGGAFAGPFATVRDCTFLVCGSATAPALLVLNESLVDHCLAQGNPGGANSITRSTTLNNTTANYAFASGNRPATIVTFSAATGYSSGDPLANTQ